MEYVPIVCVGKHLLWEKPYILTGYFERSDSGYFTLPGLMSKKISFPVTKQVLYL